MDPLSILSLVSAGVGGLTSLFGPKQDPHAQQRAEMQRLMAEIQAEFPDLSESLKTQSAQQSATMTRQIQDQGAAGGMPRNVIAQNVKQTQLGMSRNLMDALAKLKMQKVGTMQSLAGIAGNLPPTPVDTSGQDLLSLGIQGLGAFGFPGSGGGGGGPSQGIKDLFAPGPRAVSDPLKNFAKPLSNYEQLMKSLGG